MLQTRCRSVILPALAHPNQSDYQDAKVSIFSSETIWIAVAHRSRCGGGGRKLLQRTTLGLGDCDDG